MSLSRPLNCAAIRHILTLAGLLGALASNARAQTVSPERIILDRPEASQQMLVQTPAEQSSTGESRQRDVTRQSRFLIEPPGIATIDDRGLVRPLADGHAQLLIDSNAAGARQSVPIDVSGMTHPQPVSFRNEVMAILTKARCNTGGCHGKAEGQNGFKLSIFGFDVQSDFEAIAQESRGRRVTPLTPEQSLLYLKGSARIPHGGGRRIEPESYRDRLLMRWIREGAMLDAAGSDVARVVRIEIEPSAQILLAGESQQIRVTAINADGKGRDVTTEAEFESNAASIAEVDERGLVQASDIPGAAAILVRYLGHVAVCRITLPRPGVTFERPAEHNFVDGLVWNRLAELGIVPSELADDATFLRRVSLDTIGTLPTADEARAFLADPSPDKRAKLIDKLLDRDEYADYWTMQWLDILRADQLIITPQGAVAMQRWLHKSFTENRPFDALAHDLLTVQGNTAEEGPGSFYKILTKPDEAARSISQLLLGVRIECAQCHHHPSERWSQTDYTALAGFFTGIKLKKLPNGEQAIVSLGGKDLPHPRTSELVPAQALGAEPADFSNVSDRRRILANWMTAPDNPFFARAIANRLWAHYFGRGLIEPVDDLRETNPATNEPLMQALTQHMKDVRFDLKAFTRTLLNSRVYQLSAETNPANDDDQQNFSHAAWRSMPAEVLLDAISQSAGVAEKFNGWPEGYRAIQIWDNRMPSYFFRIFGRPVRASVCECERSGEPGISQALHLLNSPEIAEKIAHRHGRARTLAATDLPAESMIEQLYLTTLSRFPTQAERQLMQQAFASGDRAAAAEDILWALMNSKEFVFNH
ncbi:DUF1553 domain-containing protein [bacterium]|nr:DUF1553 domain-containing protein [bacterium]